MEKVISFFKQSSFLALPLIKQRKEELLLLAKTVTKI